MRTALLFGLLLFAVAVSALGQTPAPRLTGTFLQLLEEHGSWTDAQWAQLFDSLKSLGVQDIVVQWSVVGNLAFYPSLEFRTVRNVPLETVLRMADSAQMKVRVGLISDPAYWSYVQKDPQQVADYLQGLRDKSLAAAGELAPMLKRHPCVQGWYISEEIDDISWRSREARSVLFAHVSKLSAELHQLLPKGTVSISAFSQAQSSPEGFEQFWDEFFRRTGVDTVLYQDGVGAGKMDLNDLPVYLEAIRGAADKNRRTATVVIELFTQTAGPPIDNSAFKAVPASFNRIGCQLAMAARYSVNGIVGFSIPDYMTPQGGPAAGKLFSQYQALITQGGRWPCERSQLSLP